MPTTHRHPVRLDGETAEVGTAAELVVLVEVLHGKRLPEVIEQLRPHLPAILGGPEGLGLVFRAVDPAARALLVAALGGSFAGLVGGATGLARILALTADPEVEILVLGTVGAPALRGFVRTAHQLAEVLQWIYGECDHLLLDLLGPGHLRGLFHEARDLAHALSSLDPRGQEQLLEILGPGRAAELVHDAHDLGALLRALHFAAACRFLDAFPREALVRVIGDAAAWRHLCRRLPDEEAQLLFARLGVKTDAP